MTAHPGTRAVLEVVALGGIGEVTAGTDLAEVVLVALEADPAGPLRDGDVVVVTSKVVSKSEGRTVPADEREEAISAESIQTVARRGPTRIVRNAHGLVLAAAGVDSSNVDVDTVLLLPHDPDASAERIRSALARRTGVRVGVVVSDTLGRAWRVGQSDVAIGAAGLRVLDDYVGRRDAYGNDLRVTAVAVADEIAGAADLAKTKLGGRPVALVRGLAHLVLGAKEGLAPQAHDLVRPPAQDLFGLGSREAVLAAVLDALGQPDRFERLVELDPADRADALLDGSASEALAADPGLAGFVRRLLAVEPGAGSR